MAKKESGRRTKTEDLSQAEQELTAEQKKKVKGGAKGGTGSKSLGQLLALVGSSLVRATETSLETSDTKK